MKLSAWGWPLLRKTAALCLIPCLLFAQSDSAVVVQRWTAGRTFSRGSRRFFVEALAPALLAATHRSPASEHPFWNRLFTTFSPSESLTFSRPDWLRVQTRWILLSTFQRFNLPLDPASPVTERLLHARRQRRSGNDAQAVEALDAARDIARQNWAKGHGPQTFLRVAFETLALGFEPMTPEALVFLGPNAVETYRFHLASFVQRPSDAEKVLSPLPLELKTTGWVQRGVRWLAQGHRSEASAAFVNAIRLFNSWSADPHAPVWKGKDFLTYVEAISGAWATGAISRRLTQASLKRVNEQIPRLSSTGPTGVSLHLAVARLEGALGLKQDAAQHVRAAETWAGSDPQALRAVAIEWTQMNESQAAERTVGHMPESALQQRFSAWTEIATIQKILKQPTRGTVQKIEAAVARLNEPSSETDPLVLARRAIARVSAFLAETLLDDNAAAPTVFWNLLQLAVPKQPVEGAQRLLENIIPVLGEIDWILLMRNVSLGNLAASAQNSLQDLIYTADAAIFQNQLFRFPFLPCRISSQSLQGLRLNPLFEKMIQARVLIAMSFVTPHLIHASAAAELEQLASDGALGAEQYAEYLRRPRRFGHLPIEWYGRDAQNRSPAPATPVVVDPATGKEWHLRLHERARFPFMKHPTFAIPLGWAERRWFYRDVNSGEIFSIEIPWDMTDMGAQSEAAVSILQSIYESDGVVGVLKILQTFAEAANAARRTPASREHAEPNAAIYDILDDALVAQWIKTLPLEARATLRSKYFTWADPEDSGIPTRPVHPALLLFLSHAVVDKILADAINPALYPRAKASICSNDKISDISLQRCGHFVSIGQFLQKYLSPAELKIVRGQGVWVQVSGRVMHLPSALLSEMVVIPGDYFWVTPPRFFEQVDAFEIQPDPVGRKISFGVGLLNSVPGLLGLSQVSASFQKAQTLVQIIHQWMSRWMPFDRFHLSRTAIVLSGMVLAVPAVWLMKELTATFHRSFKRLRSAKNPEAQSA